MIPASMANHPDVVALEDRLREKFAAELADQATRSKAEERIMSEIVNLEMALLRKMPHQGEVFW